MEIELIKKEQEEKKVKFEELKIGTVIVFTSGLYGLVIKGGRIERQYTLNGKSVLLLGNCNQSWTSVALGFMDSVREGHFKVIGKAKKLIVEEI